MALPTAEQNIVGCQLTNTELGLVVVASANVATQTGSTITDNAPRTILVVAKLASGTVKIDLDRAASGNPTFASPVDSFTMTGNASSCVVKMDTTASALNWAAKITSTSGLLSSFAVLDLGQLSAGEDWVNITSGQNAFASSVTGDGSGAFSIVVVN